MKKPWANMADRIKTNHPGATVKIRPDNTIEIVLGSITVVAWVTSGGGVEASVTGKDRARFDTVREGEGYVMDALNEAWASNQKPRTSAGGPSSHGTGDGGDDAIGDTVVESDDGEDE